MLDNVVVARAFTWEHQMDLLVAIAAKMVEEPFKASRGVVRRFFLCSASFAFSFLCIYLRQNLVFVSFALPLSQALIIDSLMGVIKTDFSGRGELSERQQMLGKMLRRVQGPGLWFLHDFMCSYLSVSVKDILFMLVA